MQDVSTILLVISPPEASSAEVGLQMLRLKSPNTLAGLKALYGHSWMISLKSLLSFRLIGYESFHQDVPLC